MLRGHIPLEAEGGEGLDLPLIAWEGGSAYWAQFAKADAAGWSDPSFFPIAVFLGKADSGHPADLASLGINTLMAAEHQTPVSNVTDHLFLIAQSPESHPTEWTQAEIGSDPGVVGWFVYDECEQGEGACATGPDSARLALFTGWVDDTRAYADGRFMFANFGNGVLNSFWAVGTMPDWLDTIDACAVDKYAYTSPGVRFEIERSGDWPLGDTPADNSEIAAAYGWFVDQMQGFMADGTTGLKPIWCFIETMMPFLAEAGADVILWDELKGGVWSSLIREGRGIAYFQHNGFYNGGLPVNDPNTGLPHTTDTYSIVEGPTGLRTTISAINTQVLALAPVLNTQSYVWDAGATGIDTMTKAHDGFCYMFACLAPGGATGSKTFDVPPGVTGSSAVVVDESRSVSISGGSFTDSFANEYSYHIYKVAI